MIKDITWAWTGRLRQCRGQDLLSLLCRVAMSESTTRDECGISMPLVIRSMEETRKLALGWTGWGKRALLGSVAKSPHARTDERRYEAGFDMVTEPQGIAATSSMLWGYPYNGSHRGFDVIFFIISRFLLFSFIPSNIFLWIPKSSIVSTRSRRELNGKRFEPLWNLWVPLL